MKKRIALSAVAALAGGLLVAAPASAAAGTAAAVGTASQGVSLAGTATTTVSYTAAAAADTAVVTLTVPTGSAVTLSDNNGAGAGTTAALAATTNVSVGTDKATLSATAVGAATATATIVPDVAGTYTITITATTAASANIYAADVFAKYADGIDGTGALQKNISVNGVAGAGNSVTLSAVALATGTRLVTVTGGTIGSASAGDVIASDAKSLVLAATAGTRDFTVLTPAAGTITVNLFKLSQSGIYSTTSIGTVTITVNSAAVNGSLDVANSTAAMNVIGVTGGYLSTDALTAYSPKTANAKAATIAVDLAVASGATLASTTVTAVTIDGPGLVGLDMDSSGTEENLGRSLSYTGADDVFNVIVKGDGISGTATVKVVTGAFAKSFTVKFYGSVASYKLTAKNAVLSVGTTDTQVVTVQALDAAGIAVPSAVVYATSSSTATATVSSAAVTTGADGAAVDLGATAFAKGATTITFADAATAATVTATYALNVVTAGISSVALSFDKAEYAPGEKATITVTAKNADGDLVGDKSFDNFFKAETGISASAALVGDVLTSDTVETTNGVKTYTVYMPLTAGPVNVSALLGDNAAFATAIKGLDVAVSASAKVVAPVDATVTAINAKVVSTEATVAALQVTVASVIKSLKVQWWLLKKIAVKVGIKLG